MSFQLPFAPFFAGYDPSLAGPRVGVPELLLLTMVALAITLIPTSRLATIRKVGLIGLLGAAALITPTPDPITLGYVFVPLYLLFELVLLVGRVVWPRHQVRA